VSGQAGSGHRLVGIQLLRGLAASMVVVSHANTMMGHGEFFGLSPFPILDTGAFGVSIFFVISGFIIVFVSLNGQGDARVSTGTFAWRRFVRIVPFMWLCTLGYNLLSYAGTHQVEWGPMLRALVLSPVGELKPNVLWSLRHELIFYALFAVALLGTRRRIWLLYAWFAAPLVYAALSQAGLLSALADRPLAAEFLKVLLMGSEVGANFQFAAGFLLGILYLRSAPILRARAWAGLLVAAFAVIAADVVVEATAIPSGLWRAAAWTALAAPLVWLALVAPHEDTILSRAAEALGDASFSIYLVHNPVLLILFRLARPLAAHVPLAGLYFVFVGGAIVAGIIVHRLVERPLLAWASGRSPHFRVTGAGRAQG